MPAEQWQAAGLVHLVPLGRTGEAQREYCDTHQRGKFSTDHQGDESGRLRKVCLPGTERLRIGLEECGPEAER